MADHSFSTYEPLLHPKSTHKVPLWFSRDCASFLYWASSLYMCRRARTGAFLPFLATVWRHHKPPLRGGRCASAHDAPRQDGERVMRIRRASRGCSFEQLRGSRACQINCCGAACTLDSAAKAATPARGHHSEATSVRVRAQPRLRGFARVALLVTVLRANSKDFARKMAIFFTPAARL